LAIVRSRQHRKSIFSVRREDDLICSTGAIVVQAEGLAYFYANGVRQEIGPEDAAARDRHESLIAAEYQRCHPGDSLESLKHRARFSKEDRALLREWMKRASKVDRESAGEQRRAQPAPSMA
jgi:hypothetical protein